jgi:hypothetical protein
VIAITAKAVDHAYSRTVCQEHDDEAGPTLGTSTPGEIFYHLGKQLSLGCISMGATNMPKESSLVEKSTGG